MYVGSLLTVVKISWEGENVLRKKYILIIRICRGLFENFQVGWRLQPQTLVPGSATEAGPYGTFRIQSILERHLTQVVRCFSSIIRIGNRTVPGNRFDLDPDLLNNGFDSRYDSNSEPILFVLDPVP